MKDLFFLVNWENNPQKAWSGTCYSLYKALSNHFNVKDIDLYKSRRNIVLRFLQKLKIMSNDFGYNGILQSRKFVNKKFPEISDNIIFQFEEIVTGKIFSTYLYQDLSVSYLKFLSETDSKILKYSGFNTKNIDSAILKRYNSQIEYYKSCKAIFTMGKWLKKDLVERCGIPDNKVFHVGGGINLDINKINPKPKTNNKILFVGRDFKRKGGFLVYEAFKYLRNINNEVQLFVAGPIKNPIIEPIEGYIFLGECSHDQLSDLFNTCDIFCMPSYFEAYGLVFVEALSYGLPCIGRNAYEMPYFIENNETGYLLDKDDPKELASLMDKLLTNKYIKDNVLKRKKWYLDEYSWSSVASRIFNVINNT